MNNSMDKKVIIFMNKCLIKEVIMKTKEGKYIVSCVMTDDVRRDGPCASCGYLRNWVNCESLHEGDESF